MIGEIYEEITILSSDKKRLQEKADEMGEDIKTIVEWLVEEYLDELV